MDYLVIMRMGDTKDPELQRRRAELRPAHLERATSFRERGHVMIGGAIFDDDGKPPAPRPSPASTRARRSTPGSRTTPGPRPACGRISRSSRSGLRSIIRRRRDNGLCSQRHYASSTTLFRSTPISGTSTSTTSPGLSHFGGLWWPPAPVGVPVQIRSPGLSVVKVEM